MEYINEINILEAVVHILDTNADEPILNSYSLELDEEVYKFIFKHLERTLKDEELKYAFFNDGRGVVKEISQDYLNGKIDIIETSTELAKQLFYLMKSNRSIASCDLMIVSFTTEYGPMLGIIKMDYVKNFSHTVDFLDGKMCINIIPQLTGLPVSAQKIEKCAFIKLLSDNMNFNLMVMDKNLKNKNNEEYGSNYFINSFLNCKLIKNERDMTKNFISAAEEWTRTNVTADASKAENIRTAVKKVLSESDTVHIGDFTDGIFGDEQDKNSFKEYISAKGLQEEIAIDKQWVEKKLKRVRLKIDKTMDLYIDEEAYNDDSRFEIIRNGDGSINMLIKHVTNYIEK